MDIFSRIASGMTKLISDRWPDLRRDGSCGSLKRFSTRSGMTRSSLPCTRSTKTRRSNGRAEPGDRIPSLTSLTFALDQDVPVTRCPLDQDQIAREEGKIRNHHIFWATVQLRMVCGHMGLSFCTRISLLYYWAVFGPRYVCSPAIPILILLDHTKSSSLTKARKIFHE